MRTKKFLSMLLSMAMLIGTTTVVNAAPTEGQADDENMKMIGGYIPSELDYNTPVYEPEISTYSDDSLESKYPVNGISDIESKYPETRNQNPYGTCWAFASIGLAEFDLINDGSFQKDVDLSELQLAYYTYNGVTDPLGGTEGDISKYYTNNSGITYGYLMRGGNYLMASRRLGQWSGVVEESDVPYSYVSDNGYATSNVTEFLNSGIDDEYAYSHDVAYLKNTYLINIKENSDEVKKQIKEHGAVGIMYSHADAGYNYLSNSYYDISGMTGGGHAVMAVGWDDNYSKDNFKSEVRPTEDGAWLIRNSWGDYCDYFWMSYSTYSLGDTAWVFDFSKDKEYDNNYQLDGGLEVAHNLNYRRVANVFTTQNNDNVTSEELKAVSLSFTQNTNVNYTIDVYTDLTDTTKPLSGTKQEYATTTGSTTYAGVYTVPLKSSVNLKPGTTYSVVVTTDSPALDYEFASNSEANNGNIVWDHRVSQNYKSFYCYGTDLAYSTGWPYGNYCIKAFTSNVYPSPLGDKLAGYNLSLDGTIGINFFMTLPTELANSDDTYMEFTLPDGTKSDVKVSEAVKSGDYYVFTCNVMASNMTSDVYAKIISGDDEGKTYTYTVKQYGDYIINHPDKYSDASIKMVKSLLNYGAAAQNLFGINTDKMANADLSDEDKELADIDFSPYRYTCTKDSSVSGISYYGSLLNLNTETCVKDFFLLDSGENIDNYTFSYQIDSGESVEIQPWKTVMAGKECYGITIGNMKAFDLDKDITVTIKKSGQENATGMVLKYGTFSYADQVTQQANPKESLVSLNKALYWYCINAKQYKYGQ